MLMNVSPNQKEEEYRQIRIPLLNLQVPKIKGSIRKNKEASYVCKGKQIPSTGCPKEQVDDTMLGVCKLKKRLKIEIPTDCEATPITPGRKVKTDSNYADTTEAGRFYGVTLKKGAYKRTNEDRVRILALTYI